MLPRRSVLTGLFGCGGGGRPVIDARFLYLTGEGGVRGVAGEEGLVNDRLDVGKR